MEPSPKSGGWFRRALGVNGVTYGTSTALDSAVQGHQLAAVKVLLELGADPNGKPNEVTPLMRASLKGGTDIVLALIQGGAKVDLAAPGGRTALMWAAGHPETMEALIKAGAQVNQQTDNGPSPLMAAVWGCNGDAVRELMKAGATLGPNDWKKDRPPQLDDFPVKDIYHGASAAVDLNSNPYAREYRTRCIPSCIPHARPVERYPNQGIRGLSARQMPRLCLLCSPSPLRCK